MLGRYIIYLLLIIFTSCDSKPEYKLFLAQPANYAKVKIIENIALDYLSNNDIDNAIVYCQEAINFSAHFNKADRAKLYLTLSACFFEKNLLNDCITTINTVLELYEDIQNKESDYTWIRANIMIANCYRLLNKYSLALSHIEMLDEEYSCFIKKSSDFSYCDFADIKSWKALFLSNIGEYELSILNNLLAINYFKKGNCSNCVIANNYSQIGSVFALLKDFDKAELYYLNALEILKDCFGEESLYYADNVTELGLLYYETQEYQKALECFITSHNIIQNNYSLNEVEYAYSYNNLGDTYCQLGEQNKGIQYYLSALKLFENYNLFEEICIVYHNLGNAYSYDTNYKLSKKYYYKSIELSNKIRSQKNLYKAFTHQRLGELFLKQDRLDEAYLHFTKAVQELSLLNNDSSFYNLNFLKSGILSKPVLYECLYYKGLSSLKLFEINHNNNYLDGCISSFNKAFQVLDVIRNTYTDEKAKVNLAKISTPLINYYLYASFLKDSIFDTLQRDQKILEVIERTKYSALRSLIYLTKPSFTGDLPIRYKYKIDSLNKRIRYYENIQNNMINTNPQTSIMPFEDPLFKNIYSLDSLYNFLRSEYPDYNKEQYKFTFYSITDIQKLISDSVGIIEYHFVDSLLIVFAIRKSSYQVHYRKLDATFAKKVEYFSNSILFSNTKDINEYGIYLYNHLIEPVYSTICGLKSLIVIPDNKLSMIPFEVLIKPSEYDSNKTTSICYLIHEFELSYQYSINLWGEKRKKRLNNDTVTWKNYFSGYAPVSFYSNNKNIDSFRYLNLPFSKIEIENISKAFIEKGLKANFHLGNQSTEISIIDELQKSKIVHIATHSNLSSCPSNFYILLSGSHDYTEKIDEDAFINNKYHFLNPNDGKLTLAEIYNLDINTDLVTISTCNSGQGYEQIGEGIKSLSLGFYYAGASNILYTLWDISDKHTYKFMMTFYSYVNEGLSYSCALRKSKLDFIHSKYQLPIFWSSYLLIG